MIVNDNPNKQAELDEIDSRIKEFKDIITRKEDLESLFEDKRFQNVMLYGYIEAEAERIFGLLLDPTHNLKRDVMENLTEKMMSIRNVKTFYRVIKQSGDSASEQLEELEDYRVKINSGDSIIDVEEV